jgi:hypothetical protein
MRVIKLVILTIFICSCNGHNTATNSKDIQEKIKEIHLVSEPDSIITKISDIASDIIYVPLQPSGKTLIENLDKIIVRGSKIYINLIDNILCFDNKGHFLYMLYDKVKRQNIAAVYDFDINEADTSLAVLSGNRLLQFKNSGSGFVFTKTLSLGNYSPSLLNFVPCTNNILFSAIRLKGDRPSFNVLINFSGDRLTFKPYYFKKFDLIANGFWDAFIQYQFDNQIYFKERFNDTVFSVSRSNKFIPVLIFNSGLSSTTPDNIRDPLYYRLLPEVDNIFEFQRYLFYDFSFANESHQVFFDKNDGKKYEIKTWNGFLRDDIAGGPDFYPEYCSSGKIYSWISVSDMRRYINREDFAKAQVHNPQKLEDLKKLSVKLKNTDNPILIVVTLKN